MSSRIEQIIEEIEEYVDSCKYQPLSTTKIIVNKRSYRTFLICWTIEATLSSLAILDAVC